MEKLIYLKMKNKKINWERFLVTDIFEIENSKPYHMTELTESVEPKSIPYVTRTNQNNGLEATVIAPNNVRVNNKNVISFGAENATFFFQPYSFITGNKMYVAKNRLINRYSGLFLKVVFDKSIENCGFGYGKGLTGTRLAKRYIMLPTNSVGKPDWDFMESYMRNIEKSILQNVIKIFAKRITNNAIVSPPPSTSYKEFYFSEVFDEIQRGRRLTKSNQIAGQVPYVSSTAENNGIDDFIGNEENIRKFENCLSLSNSGSVGRAFFHSYKFIASDHVTKLKNIDIDKYSYLYMVPIINKLSEKYSFNREITDLRIKREKILLPITESQEIDFTYMSNFMRTLEAKTLKETIALLTLLYDNKQVSPPFRYQKNEDIRWRHYFLFEIFEHLEQGMSKGLNHLERDDKKGISYLGATNQGNGVLCFVKQIPQLIQKGNCIAFIRNGEGSMGYSIYKAEDFISTSDISLGYNLNLNKYTGTFITTIADRVRGKYNFGYKRTALRLKKEVLTLPSYTRECPNWENMEFFMRNKEQLILLDYLKFIEEIL